MSLNDYFEHLDFLKLNGVDNNSIEPIIELVNTFINELEYYSKRDIKNYAKCQFEYILQSFIYYPYNEDVLHELSILKEEAKYQRESLRRVKRILRKTPNNILVNTIVPIYETTLNIADLQVKRNKYFDYLTIIDTMKYKNITYIPSEEVTRNNKELVKKIDTSLKKLSKVGDNI